MKDDGDEGRPTRILSLCFWHHQMLDCDTSCRMIVSLDLSSGCLEVNSVGRSKLCLDTILYIPCDFLTCKEPILILPLNTRLLIVILQISERIGTTMDVRKLRVTRVYFNFCHLSFIHLPLGL